MRLIDKDALLEEINDLIQIWSGGEKDLSIGHKNGLESAKEYIDDAPTIDAEPVVRCKDCKYYQGEYRYCANVIFATPNDYCSMAKPKIIMDEVNDDSK